MMGFTMTEGGFGVTDWVVFVLLCTGSCSGGLWYSAKASRKERVVDVRDYLLGGRHLSTFPVALSLIASYVSGVTILGTPAEIYNYGLQYLLIILAIAISCTIVGVVYVPVFCLLGLSSSYEYLELRFNRHVRAVASLLFMLDEVLFLPMVIYVPALAFNQLTGFNQFAVGGVMVLITGIYTVLGGLRAVVWTDSVQTGVMYLGVFVLSIVGIVVIDGGMSTVFSTAQKTGRLSLDNWNFSPYERQSGWGVIVGGSLYWTCFNSVNQTMVQRYISLSSKKHTIRALIIFCLGAMLAICLCVWCGLLAWTAWVTGGCSPTGQPVVHDRLLPAFVTYVGRTQNIPGLNGVFLAGVFGAGFSSLSAILNACALVGVEDILRGWLRVELKPLIEGLIARFISALLAVISVVMLLVIEKLGGVLGVATALSAIAASTTCGIFTLGMVCWWVGPKGAIAGAVTGAIFAGTVSFGTQAAAAAGLRHPPLPFESACPANVTFKPELKSVDPDTIFPVFRLSFHWIAPIGLLATLIVGSIVGWFFDKRENQLDQELFTPVMWRFLPPEYRQNAGEIREKILSKERKRGSILLAHQQVLPRSPLIEREAHTKKENYHNTPYKQEKMEMNKSVNKDEKGKNGEKVENAANTNS